MSVIIDYPYGITEGPDQNIWFTSVGNSSIERITPEGVVTAWSDTDIDSPQYITSGPSGPGAALWYTNYANSTIGRITTAGVTTLYTAPSGKRSYIASPAGIATGPDGALWFCNFRGNTIGRITVAGVITNYKGSGIGGPMGITAGPSGAMWFTNFQGNSIGRITTAGVVEVPSPNSFNPVSAPLSITFADGSLWFTSTGNNLVESTTGHITKGKITIRTYGNSAIDEPYSIAPGPSSTLWFTNSGSNAIAYLKL